MPFPPLSASVDLPALEREVLARWHATDVFARSLEQTAGGELWTVYEGPPTANGKPGTHHVEARVFKDLFPRFHTMRGRRVPRRAGWDCHGLPVELAVEKELGFTSKHDIEDYGIAAFNAHCRESVQRHVGEFERLTERMGYWVDLGDAYRTMDPQYIDSVWWSLQRIAERGLLVEDHRVAPYCPRCETGLSDHEVASGYTEVVDPSVYVRFPLLDAPGNDLPAALNGADLLVWTTTPWTLVSNTAVAVHPDVTYVVARPAGGGAPVVVAEPLLADALDESGVEAEILASVTGAQLEGLRYRRPLDLLEIPDPTGVAHRVVLADYVTVDSGTGLVHQSPAFGAEDLAVARAYGLPVVNPIGSDGRFAADVPLVGGMFFKTADATLVDRLRESGVLHRYLPYRHSYPLCWRCDTALLYYALPSWYIRTTAVKDPLLAENAATDWHPTTIRDGRYGEWLRGNVDWALSRRRYWGTPLPVWRCDADPTHVRVVGSRAELAELAVAVPGEANSGAGVATMDPHRPFVDDIVIPCAHCDSPAHRVPEVIDCWYDSGAMPFAQLGYPHLASNADLEQAYPADYICEAIDQTRGWFYTLMAIGTLVFDRSSYRTVLCLGHIVDSDGRKMSKHLGNVLDPFEVFETSGADALRWLMLCSGSPWSARRVGPEPLADVVRQVLLTYWNTVSFLTLYARANRWEPGAAPASPAAQRPVLDRWALARMQRLTAEVTEALESFDSTRAGRALGQFIDELSNWYVRRSRRRFWAGDPDALSTLHECLVRLTTLLAPFIPFLTDAVWQALVVAVDPAAPDSVHLAPWPEDRAAGQDGAEADTLLAEVSLIRRVVELGRTARAGSSVKTRQPLARAIVAAPGLEAVGAELLAQIAEELNVVAVEVVAAGVSAVSYKPNFRVLGKQAGDRTKVAAAAITAGEFDRAGDEVIFRSPDLEDLRLPATVLFEQRAAPQGYAAASDGGVSVALDLTLTDDLRRLGLLRDAVRQVQEARKRLGLDVTDRVELWWEASPEMAVALRTHGATLAEEVLAVSMTEGAPAAAITPHPAPELGLTFWVRAAGE